MPQCHGGSDAGHPLAFSRENASANVVRGKVKVLSNRPWRVTASQGWQTELSWVERCRDVVSNLLSDSLFWGKAIGQWYTFWACSVWGVCVSQAQLPASPAKIDKGASKWKTFPPFFLFAPYVFALWQIPCHYFLIMHGCSYYLTIKQPCPFKVF